jgi:hypothetical protein
MAMWKTTRSLPKFNILRTAKTVQLFAKRISILATHRGLNEQTLNEQIGTKGKD